VTITYPITLPVRPGFKRTSFRQVNITAESASPFTGQRQIFKHPGEYWEASLQLPPMRGVNAAAWEAALVSLQGMTGTFLLGDPDRPLPRGTALGTPVADSAASPVVNTARSRQLFTRGWTSSQAGVLLAADYIQVGTGEAARLHKNLTDAAADSSGYAVFDVWPALYTDIPDGATITVINAKGVFRLTGDTDWSSDEAKTYGFSFAARSEV
jgi:hypothetical protein